MTTRIRLAPREYVPASEPFHRLEEDNVTRIILACCLLTLCTLAVAEPPAGVPLKPLDAGALTPAVGVYRTQKEWDKALGIAEKYKTHSESRPVDWTARMVIAAPAFVSFVQRKEQTITVNCLGETGAKDPLSAPYLISVPASPGTVCFARDPAMHDGRYFKATAEENHYGGISKTVVLFPQRGSGTNTRQQLEDTVYAPVSDSKLRTIAGQMEAMGFRQLPGKSTDPSGWSGEGWSCQVWAVVDGRESSASFDGLSRSSTPKALLNAVRLIFAAGGSPSLTAAPPFR